MSENGHSASEPRPALAVRVGAGLAYVVVGAAVIGGLVAVGFVARGVWWLLEFGWGLA